MMVLIAIKSVVIAGATLLALRFMRDRSASDRSWIAHLGLAALAALPFGALLFPPLEATTSYASVLADAATARSGAAWIAPFAPAARTQGAAPDLAQAAANWLLAVYAALALLLLARTLLSLLRLVRLTARARAVTEPHWLEALARAQRRIGFTKSTALLVSPEIASPVSWGVLRPRILLNSDAIAARTDANAIVAHELAHVARADWAKLVLARASVALFWFNPFAWLLAREAHQLREEAADDAVLAAGVEDTAYASLLVGAARLHSRSLLLGAHGVAPARNSLARRVRRVLDRGSKRSPGGTRWAAAMAIGAAALAAPLMTLQLTDTRRASPVSAQDVVTFDLRVPERGATGVAALAGDAAAQSKVSAEPARVSAGADRQLQGGRE
jgi:beta-lactamase regulating signal transducer with metallopeptidase domain